MARHDPNEPHEATEPEGKRKARHGVDPKSQPAEYADDMRVNRFRTPPEPGEKGPKKKK